MASFTIARNTSKSIEGQDLGHIIEYFPVRKYQIKRWLMLIGGLLLIMAAVYLSYILITTTLTAIQIHGPAMLLRAFPMPLVLYLILLIGGFVTVILGKAFGRNNISLFENGLIIDKRNKIKILYYEDITRFDNDINEILFGGLNFGGKVNIILEDQSSQLYKIRNIYTRMQVMILSLRDRILPGLIQRTRQAIHEGQGFKFHNNLSATTKGLSIYKKIFSYEELAITITNQTIKLHKRNNPNKPLFRTKTKKIRNLDCLIDLIESPPHR